MHPLSNNFELINFLGYKSSFFPLLHINLMSQMSSNEELSLKQTYDSLSEDISPCNRPSPSSQNLHQIDVGPSGLKTLDDEGFLEQEKLIKDVPKEPKKKSRVKAVNENVKKGHWTSQENKKYHWFLEIYNQHFIQKEMRRLDKIFKTMSRFISTREAEQCRSHHQKMEKKYHSFEKILLYLREAHYGTFETGPILEQMNKNEVKEKGVLLEERELQSKQEKQSALDTPRTLVGGNIFIQMQSPQDIPIFPENNWNSFQNILGNDYEMQLHFIDELLF